MILGGAVRLVTPQIIVHTTHLGSNWVAYPTYPPIRVPLCLDLEQFCDWLGLDLERWRDGFNTMEEVYMWIASSRGVLDIAWRKVQRRDPLVARCGRVGQRRNAAWRAFCDWLEAREMEFEDSEEEGEDPARAAEADGGRVHIHPDMPSPIHPLLAGALDRWGKRREMDAALAERKVTVTEEWERRRAKEWRKERCELARVAGSWIDLMGIEDSQPWESNDRWAGERGMGTSLKQRV